MTFVPEFTLAVARKDVFDAAILAKPAEPVRQKVPAFAAWALHDDHPMLIGSLAERLGRPRICKVPSALLTSSWYALLYEHALHHMHCWYGLASLTGCKGLFSPHFVHVKTAIMSLLLAGEAACSLLSELACSMPGITRKGRSLLCNACSATPAQRHRLTDLPQSAGLSTKYAATYARERLKNMSLLPFSAACCPLMVHLAKASA